MITVLLVVIALLLALIARGLYVINDNIVHFGRKAKSDSTDTILLLRGNNVRLDEVTEAVKAGLNAAQKRTLGR